jgi:hypothetical protein
MHREWVQVLLVVGLMTSFGLGAAGIALASPQSPPEIALASLAGGILFGGLVGVAIVFSQTPTYGPSQGRASDAISRRTLQRLIAQNRLSRSLGEGHMSREEKNGL